MVLFKTPEAAEKFLKRDLLMLEKKVDAILYSDIGKLIGKYYPGVYTPPPLLNFWGYGGKKVKLGQVFSLVFSCF